jgi:DNA-binding CsgD family transcriptional regulator
MPPCDALTIKEVQVSMLVWEGRTNRQIAVVIGTTEQVIKNYLRGIFDKLGVWNRLELALYVAAHGGAGWKQLPAYSRASDVVTLPGNAKPLRPTSS